MALLETKPALRSFRIVRAKALARTSAARLCASPLLILPFVTRPRRARTLATVVRCHLPPSLVGVSLRFNSFASAGWDTNPAAISSRRVEAKARARESAARLTAKGPNIPFFRDDVCPRAVFIGPSWPRCDTAADVKFVSRSARTARHRLWPPTCPHGRRPDGRSSAHQVDTRAGQTAHANIGSRVLGVRAVIVEDVLNVQACCRASEDEWSYHPRAICRPPLPDLIQVKRMQRLLWA
jgi:hypothetical protein